MRKPFFAVTAAAVALSLLGFSLAAGQDAIAPDFILSDLDRKTVSLSDYKDKQSVLLFFWTTWCPYCRRELKLLNEKYATITADGVELLAVNVKEPAERVANFCKSYNFSFKLLLDEDAAVALDYDLLGFPTYVFIDRKGYIRFVGFSFPEEEYKHLIKN